MHLFHACAHEDLPDAPPITNLTSYLHGRRCLEKTLDTFCQPIEDRFMNISKSHLVESPLLDLWTAVISVASATAHTSEKRQKLADFVIALQFRPMLTKGDETCQLQGKTAWKDLPGFGMQMREAWNLAATSNSDDKHKDAWVNLNAWTARLTAGSQTSKKEASDFSLLGLWVLRTALEQQEEVPDVDIRAAASWLIYAALTIWTLCQQEVSFEGKLAKLGPAFASRQWRGFERDRWTSWEVQLRHIAGRGSRWA